MRTINIQGPAQKIFYITHPAVPSLSQIFNLENLFASQSRSWTPLLPQLILVPKPVNHDPVMPEVNGFEARIPGLSTQSVSKIQFTWEAALDYSVRAVGKKSYKTQVVFRGKCQGGGLPKDFFQNNLGVVTMDSRGSPATDRYIPVSGGNLSLSVSASVKSEVFRGRLGGYMILAKDNPPTSAIKTVLTECFGPKLSPWLLGISSLETGNQQFYLGTESAGTYWYTHEPLMNKKGDGGAGLMQITNPAPGPDELWNWKANIKAASNVVAEKLDAVDRYVRKIQEKHLNESQGMIRVPGLAPEQVVEDMVRGYNGFSGGHHEFEFNRKTRKWVRFDAKKRSAGDPNYVEHIRSRIK